MKKAISIATILVLAILSMVAISDAASNGNYNCVSGVKQNNMVVACGRADGKAFGVMVTSDNQIACFITNNKNDKDLDPVQVPCKSLDAFLTVSY